MSVMRLEMSVMRLATTALALGCATAAPPPPKPVTVTEREVDALRGQLAAMPGVSAPPSAYQVSEVFVDDRVAVLTWRAEVRGEGWRRTEHALCRRCGDDFGWFCARKTASVFVESSGGAFAEVHGVSVEEAAKAVAFVRKRMPSRRVVRLTQLSERDTCVRFDPVSEGGGLSVVLTERDGGFDVDLARNSWFDLAGEPGMECGQMFFPDLEGLELRGCAE